MRQKNTCFLVLISRPVRISIRFCSLFGKNTSFDFQVYRSSFRRSSSCKVLSFMCRQMSENNCSIFLAPIIGNQLFYTVIVDYQRLCVIIIDINMIFQLTGYLIIRHVVQCLFNQQQTREWSRLCLSRKQGLFSFYIVRIKRSANERTQKHVQVFYPSTGRQNEHKTY